jgi:Glycosyl transferase family 90
MPYCFRLRYVINVVLDPCRFRYVINLDGYTASTRMAKLMHINSPLLRQAGHWIEHYHR